MTVLTHIARRTFRLPAMVRLNLTLGRNVRSVATEKGFTRATLQAATGDTWMNTQRAWLGIKPMAHTVLQAQVAMRADVASIWPTTPASWA